MTYYNPNKTKTNCFTCEGRGLVYEGEHFLLTPIILVFTQRLAPIVWGQGMLQKNEGSARCREHND